MLILILKHIKKQTPELSVFQKSVSHKYDFKDLFGRVMIEPKYDEAMKFSDGMARVKLNGKRIYPDVTGKDIISLKYEPADNFAEGRAKAILNGKSFYIDKTGKQSNKNKYD